MSWTVVAGLREVGTIGALAGEPGLGASQALLMWGHPVEGVRGAELLEALLAVSDQLDEKLNGRSEPDVMVLWPDLLLLVEAKYRSANDSKPGYEGYGNYLPSPDLFAVDKQQVEQEGSYQLARNWVIGCRLADRLGVELRLINLGPAGIADAAAGFAALLSQTSARRFEHRSWQQVLAQGTPPAWLVLYADDHGLVA